MKLYVSGPMTGLPEMNAPAFAIATAALRGFGYEVVNPAELCAHLEDPTWQECMRIDLTALLGCDAVATLAGWENSRGARLECQIARELDMPTRPFAAFLAAAA